MSPQLFSQLESAISKVLDRNCEKGYWDGLVYHTLTVDMATAAALVFDANMKGQEFAEDNK